ncbi:MAG TPA: hypothetical protein VHB20_18050 [Verrucomicrobiae bacterium]|jgi:hypothetical protein|nr:hypothetical protein [Verrucomicrobiae bacterium]
MLAQTEPLRAAEGNLQQASETLETHFLTITSELEGLAHSGEEFVQQVERLVGLATGSGCDASVFSNAMQLIERSTCFLARWQEQSVKMLGQLRQYNTQIEHLIGVEAALQRTMLPLKFMQTLFKAESAPLGTEVQRMFTGLTNEIESLHEQVREIFGAKFKQLEQTHATIAQVIRQLGEQARTLQEITTTRRAHIESSLAHLKKEMASNRARDARLARLSHDLAGEIGQVVLGLQFQDIVNQKVQHIAAALPVIQERCEEVRALPPGRVPAQTVCFIQQSARLETAQIAACEAELSRAETAMRESLGKALQHLTEADSECLSLEEFQLLTTSFDGMVQVLVETIEEVRALVRTTVANAARAYELLRPLGSLASDLTGIVRAVSARIHVIGLNAQVQAALAAQDPRGASLEVLSARTSEVSRETNRISAAAAGELDILAGGLAECVAAFAQLQADGLAQQQQLDQQGGTEESGLHAFRDEALKTLGAITESFDQIQTQARRAIDSLQFADFYQSVLPALRAPLTAMAESAGRWREGLSAEENADLVDGFHRNYTMASEHEIHAGVMATVCPAAEPAAPELLPALAGAEAGFGQNVELF